MAFTETAVPARNGPVSRLRRLLDGLIDLEFSEALPFALLAIAFVASRVPWLDLGYGTDPDAWRVALTANYLWDEAEYLPSRLPGYPLHELVTAGLIQGGWIATNLSTVLISLVGVYLFARLARELELPNRGALTLGFAFAPLLWINSVMTMDYMWALTFILGAYLAIMRRSATVAGLCVGLATGFRLSSILMLVPFTLLLWRTQRRGELRPLLATAIATALLAYTPVLMKYGLNMLNFYDEVVPVEAVTRQLGKEGLGVVGALAVLTVLALSLGRLRRLPADLVSDAHVLAWVTAIMVFVLSYTRLPHEVAYLVPVFPFGFFLMSRYVSRGLLVAALAVIVLAGFVDVTSPDDSLGVTQRTFTTARIGKGLLLSDIETLNNQMDFAHELRRKSYAAANVNPPTIVITGFIYPEMVMLYDDKLDIGILGEDLEAISQLSDKGMAVDETRNITYTWLLDYDEFQQLAGTGAIIYYTHDAARSTYALYGYRPGYFGGHELRLSRDNPSLGKGSGTSAR